MISARRLLAPGPGWATTADVVVVGSGVAGLTVAAALAPQDSPQQHLEDTLVAGVGLCDLDAVRVLCSEGHVQRAPGGPSVGGPQQVQHEGVLYDADRRRRPERRAEADQLAQPGRSARAPRTASEPSTPEPWSWRQVAWARSSPAPPIRRCAPVTGSHSPCVRERPWPTSSSCGAGSSHPAGRVTSRPAVAHWREEHPDAEDAWRGRLVTPLSGTCFEPAEQR